MSKMELDGIKRFLRLWRMIAGLLLGVALWVYLLINYFPVAYAVAILAGLAVYSELHEDDPFTLTEIYID